MKWFHAINDYQFYLKIERGLSKNTIDNYSRDLEKLVTQVIPILSIDEVIIDRVMATSAEELELAIQGIVKNELQAIVNLGGILGFTIGILQTFILIFN